MDLAFSQCLENVEQSNPAQPRSELPRFNGGSSVGGQSIKALCPEGAPLKDAHLIRSSREIDTLNIEKIEVLDSGELAVYPTGGGKNEYSYIYRAAAEVSWNKDSKCFTSPVPKKWSNLDWYKHIVTVANSELGVSLDLTELTAWVNVTESLKNEILAIKSSSAT